MKRTFLFFLISTILMGSLYAQVIVDNNGNMGIKFFQQPINSPFTINHQGYTEDCANIDAGLSSYDTGLRVYKYGTSRTNSDYISSIRSYVNADVSSDRKAFGVVSHVYKTGGINTNTGRSYGLYGIAGNASPGWNYGVFGTLYGLRNGAGVFGSTENWDGGINTEGRFAGYFHGNVNVTNTVSAAAFTVSSDYRLKENIESLESKNIDSIMKLNVVKYNLKQLIVDAGDTTTTPIYYYTKDNNLLQKTHYGLIAQELQDIFPDLVYEGEDGYLSINYIELIPILIKSVQELKAKVDALEGKPNNAPVRTGGTTQITSQSAIQATLYQNSPNPFTENTTIRCIIPRSISKAVLYIYDMNGHQIDSMSIAERGDVSLTIEGSSLDAGIYMYSLITDGEVVDTKRLILTK